MRIALSTLGCKVNQYETSALSELFAAAGFEVALEDDGFADVYVLNSCTVTAESDRKARQMLRRFRKQNPSAVICLCGCMPQAFPDIGDRIPEADVILGTRRRSYVVKAVQQCLAGHAERIIDIAPHEAGEEFEPLAIRSFAARTRAFVKIQDGCERFCSYCIIPHARGPVRSKPLEDIRSELAALAEAGFAEVVLVGINLSCYGIDRGLHLLDAIRAACNTEGIQRVRLGSLEPESLSNEDIAAMAELPKLCPQFHLSLQSGCDATLRRMRRHYDTAEYRRIVEALRQAMSDTAITTDIMVGFPGETEEEFQQSLAFVQEIGLARAHVFSYSIRPGTHAAELPEQLSNAEKQHRSRLMIATTDETRDAFLHAQLGQVVPVLFETKRPDGLWEGYAPNYTAVTVPSEQELAGQIRTVHLTAVSGESCVGILETLSTSID